MAKVQGRCSKAAMAVMVVLCCGLCACLGACKAEAPKKADSETAAVSNPLVESTQAGVAEATGANLVAPEGASDVSYFYYRQADQITAPIAEMRFTLNGQEAYLRAQKTDMKEFPYSAEEIGAAMMSGKVLDTRTDITGLNYNWEVFTAQDVGSYDAVCFRGSGVGYIAWIDAKAGVLYNLCMKAGATDDTLLELANAAFTAIQNATA